MIKSNSFLSIVASTCLLALGTAAARTADGPAMGPGIGKLVGFWLPVSYSERLLTAEGIEPPLNSAGAPLYRAHIAEHDKPQPQFDRTRWCAGPGMPRIMFMPYPFEIRADGNYIGFIYAWYRWHRMVDMSGAKTDIVLPMTMGYPVGHWEGSALVIETAGIAGETVLDGFGLPHSEEMVLTERLRTLPNGRLEVRYTIKDDAYYTKPWEAVMTYKRLKTTALADDVCPDRIAKGEPAIRKKLP